MYTAFNIANVQDFAQPDQEGTHPAPRRLVLPPPQKRLETPWSTWEIEGIGLDELRLRKENYRAGFDPEPTKFPAPPDLSVAIPRE